MIVIEMANLRILLQNSKTVIEIHSNKNGYDEFIIKLALLLCGFALLLCALNLLGCTSEFVFQWKIVATILRLFSSLRNYIIGITFEGMKDGLQAIKSTLQKKVTNWICSAHRKDVQNRVANNYVVMRNIFGCLDVNSLKKCRLVCRSWQEISQPDFRKRVQIEFPDYSETLEKFAKNFPCGTHSTCTAFKFTGTHYNRSPVFTRFLDANVDFLTSLEIGPVNIFNKESKLKVFNINTLIGSRIRNLTVFGDMAHTQISISVDKLASVEYLRLKGIRLIVTEGCVISPKEIDFHSLSFISKEGTRITNVTVNDFLEFYRLNKININGCYNNHNYNEKINIDLPSPLKLNTMQLAGVPYAYYPDEVPEIKHLKLYHLVMDIKCLTKSLTTLEFSYINETNDEKVNLPNLKYLTCSATHGFSFSRLSTFSNCNNLVGVYLKPEMKVKCHLNWLPLSVKKVKLQNVTVIGEKFAGQLESLHLFKYGWESVHQTLTKLRTESLYISLKITNMDTETSSIYNSFFIPFLSHQHIKTFAVGKLRWPNEENFNRRALRFYVDKLSDFYIFEQKPENSELSRYKRLRGKGISETEFNKLMETFM